MVLTQGYGPYRAFLRSICVGDFTIWPEYREHLGRARPWIFRDWTQILWRRSLPIAAMAGLFITSGHVDIRPGHVCVLSGQMGCLHQKGPPRQRP